MTAENARLKEAQEQNIPWKKWGPYLSERQWGTVRADYSEGGNAWDYFSHDQARSRAYRWGEDGLAGVPDDHQRLCFALALWNGKDPILKERLFGLADRPGGAAHLAQQPGMAPRISGDPARPARGGHSGLRVRDHRLHGASGSGRGYRPDPPPRAAPEA